MTPTSFLFLTTCLCLFSTSLSTNLPSMVINVFRHGARGPDSESYCNNYWEKDQLGALTDVGMRMHYLLGASLLKSYPHLLGNGYDKNKIYIRSSAVLRCYQSVYAQLFGAFGQRKLKDLPGNRDDLAIPPYDKKILDQVIKEQEARNNTNTTFHDADIVIFSEDEDYVLQTPQTCPTLLYKSALEFMKPSSWAFYKKYFPLTKANLKKVGVEVHTPIGLFNLDDCMLSNHFEGYPLPGKLEFDSQLGRNVSFIRDWYLTMYLYNSTDQKQYLGVPLFEEILKWMDAKANNKTQTEFVFLSTHDITLMTLLAPLNILNVDCLLANYNAEKEGKPLPFPACVLPPFASTMLFEFYDDNGTQSVILKYNSVPVPLCNGQAKCSYDDFKELVSNVTNGYNLQDYKKVCLNYVKNDDIMVIDAFLRILGLEPSKPEQEKKFEETLKQERADVIDTIFVAEEVEIDEMLLEFK